MMAQKRTNKVWIVRFYLGNSGRLSGDINNRMTRANAFADAAVIDKNGWRCWIEHHATGKRIYENALEQEARAAVPAPSGTI